MKVIITDKEKFESHPSIKVVMVHIENCIKEDFIKNTEDYIQEIKEHNPAFTDVLSIYNSILNEHPVSTFELLVFYLYMTQSALSEAASTINHLESMHYLAEIISSLKGKADENFLN